MMLRVATLVALAGIAAAQIPGLASLSQGCTSAVTTLLADPEVNACLAPAALLAVATGSNDTTIIDPINTWLGNMCSAAPCSNATLASIVSNITSDCREDFAFDNTDPGQIAASITPMVQQYYPAVRSIACLRQGDTNCITQTLNTLEGALGPLSVNNIMSVLSSGTGVEKLSPNMLCTDCVKAAYNIINREAPFLIEDAALGLESQCGAAFVDGNTPSTITSVVAGGSNSNNTGGGSNTGSDNNNNGASTLTTGLVSALGVASVVVALL